MPGPAAPHSPAEGQSRADEEREIGVLWHAETLAPAFHPAARMQTSGHHPSTASATHLGATHKLAAPRHDLALRAPAQAHLALLVAGEVRYGVLFEELAAQGEEAGRSRLANARLEATGGTAGLGSCAPQQQLSSCSNGAATYASYQSLAPRYSPVVALGQPDLPAVVCVVPLAADEAAGQVQEGQAQAGGQQGRSKVALAADEAAGQGAGREGGRSDGGLWHSPARCGWLLSREGPTHPPYHPPTQAVAARPIHPPTHPRTPTPLHPSHPPRNRRPSLPPTGSCPARCRSLTWRGRPVVREGGRSAHTDGAWMWKATLSQNQQANGRQAEHQRALAAAWPAQFSPSTSPAAAPVPVQAQRMAAQRVFKTNITTQSLTGPPCGSCAP